MSPHYCYRCLVRLTGLIVVCLIVVWFEALKIRKNQKNEKKKKQKTEGGKRKKKKKNCVASCGGAGRTLMSMILMQQGTEHAWYSVLLVLLVQNYKY